MVLDAARRLWRGTVPAPARRRIRRTLTDLPHRFRDAVPDLVDGLSNPSPLPPPRLRARVGLTSSRREFVAVGEVVAAGLLEALAESGPAPGDFPAWLDFGCGSGRVARHLTEARGIRRLIGVDVDREAIGWCRRHLPGQYETIGPSPPTALPAGAIDVVCAVSVFTHMDEEAQAGWLTEIHRLLRAGGLLIVSSHSPELVWTRPDLTPVQRRRLEEEEFLFAPAAGPFNDNSTFQTEAYLRRRWSGLFAPRLFKPFGLGGYQDLSVWEKPPITTASGLTSSPSASSPPTASG